MTEKILPTPINSIVMIATGDYSDYATTPFRVLKKFTFADAMAECREQWRPEHEWNTGLSPEEFIGWLAQNGFIEDFPCHEVHVGSYASARLDADMLHVEFAPDAIGAAK